MRVRLNQIMAGDHGTYQPGEVADLPGDLAAALVRAHYADPEAPAGPASEPTPDPGPDPAPPEPRARRAPRRG